MDSQNFNPEIFLNVLHYKTDELIIEPIEPNEHNLQGHEPITNDR